MKAPGAEGATHGTTNGTGTDAWEQALRSRCRDLERDVRAGEAAQGALDQIMGLRKTIGGLGENLYESAANTLALASRDLDDYDRESQGALAEADGRVREASRRLNEHDSTKGGAEVVRTLEVEAADARRDRARLMDERVAGRDPLAERHLQATRDLLLAGIARLMDAEPRREKLEDLADAGQRAAAELRDLERMSRPTATGNEVHVTVTADTSQAIDVLRTLRAEVEATADARRQAYPAAGGRPGDIHRDAAAGAR